MSVDDDDLEMIGVEGAAPLGAIDRRSVVLGRSRGADFSKDDRGDGSHP